VLACFRPGFPNSEVPLGFKVRDVRLWLSPFENGRGACPPNLTIIFLNRSNTRRGRGGAGFFAFSVLPEGLIVRIFSWGDSHFSHWSTSVNSWLQERLPQDVRRGGPRTVAVPYTKPICQKRSSHSPSWSIRTARLNLDAHRILILPLYSGRLWKSRPVMPFKKRGLKQANTFHVPLALCILYMGYETRDKYMWKPLKHKRNQFRFVPF